MINRTIITTKKNESFSDFILFDVIVVVDVVDVVFVVA
jgi:hypothetical protein